MNVFEAAFFDELTKLGVHMVEPSKLRRFVNEMTLQGRKNVPKYVPGNPEEKKMLQFELKKKYESLTSPRKKPESEGIEWVSSRGVD
jgi:hypothetical protein